MLQILRAESSLKDLNAPPRSIYFFFVLKFLVEIWGWRLGLPR